MTIRRILPPPPPPPSAGVPPSSPHPDVGFRSPNIFSSGLIKPGNIDLLHRPVVHNPDGSISTVRSITVGTPHGFVLLPTVVGGRVVSNDAAIDHWRRSGQHLGVFASERAADRYAQQLHQSQARRYLSR
jgi:hypothetical protein